MDKTTKLLIFNSADFIQIRNRALFSGKLYDLCKEAGFDPWELKLDWPAFKNMDDYEMGTYLINMNDPEKLSISLLVNYFSHADQMEGKLSTNVISIPIDAYFDDALLKEYLIKQKDYLLSIRKEKFPKGEYLK